MQGNNVLHAAKKKSNNTKNDGDISRHKKQRNLFVNMNVKTKTGYYKRISAKLFDNDRYV